MAENTGLDTTAIRERAAAATAGPWTASTEYAHVYAPSREVAWSYQSGSDSSHFIEMRPEDRAFIAAARTDVPALLDELDAARARIAELEAENLKHYADGLEAAAAIADQEARDLDRAAPEAGPSGRTTALAIASYIRALAGR